MVKKRLLYFTGAIILVVVVIVIFLMISNDNKKIEVLTYVQVEHKIKEAAILYTSVKPSLLPNTKGEVVVLTANDLASAGYMLSLNEYLGNISCVGEAQIALVGASYTYTSILDCGTNYKTLFLYEKLLENIVVKGPGLYQMIDGKFTYGDFANDSDSVKYIFRGEDPNNYLLMDGEYWRIVEVDSNYNLLLIKNSLLYNGTGRVWDDRYNKEVGYSFGINEYSMSRIRDNLLSFYKYAGSFLKESILPLSMCISSRGMNDSVSNFEFECSKRFDEDYVGLLTVSQFISATVDKDCLNISDISCGNYNYLSSLGSSWWLLNSPGGNTCSMYYVNGNVIKSDITSASYAVRPVVLVSKSLKYVSGDGTILNPYIVR